METYFAMSFAEIGALLLSGQARQDRGLPWSNTVLLTFLILSRVGKVWYHSSDPSRTGGSTLVGSQGGRVGVQAVAVGRTDRMNHNQQLHQPVVDVPRGRGLENED